MQVSEYRVTMVHDGGTVKIVTTASSATAAVDMVVKAEGAPRRSARLVEARPLQFERTDDTWRPVPGEEWGRVDDQPANVDVHANPFVPDPENPFTTWSTQELESARASWATPHAEQFDRPDSVRKAGHVGEELSRREDVARAVSLWERLCEVPFVRGETQGYYTHSTAYLTPDVSDYSGRVKRMPDAAELEALVLSDGEETDYPVHEVETRPFILEHVSTNPWSGDDRLYPITLTLISCGDYHGSDVDAANNRALDGTPGVEVREPNTGGMGSVFNVSTTVVGEMSSFENSQTTADWEREPAQRRAGALMWLESLVEQMEGLATDTVFLDEEAHSNLIDELAKEAWDSWLESDVHRELTGMAPAYLRDPEGWIAEESAAVRDAYYAFEDNEWTVSSLGNGATNGRHDDAVKHVARTVFGWNVP